MVNEMLTSDFAELLLKNRNDDVSNRYLGYWVDDDMSEEEAIEAINKNLYQIVRDWSDETLKSNYDDMPTYVVIHLNEGSAGIELNNDGNVYILGEYASTEEALRDNARYWDESTPDVLAYYGISASDDDLDTVDEDFIGSVCVWVRYYFYDGSQGIPIDGFAQDEQSGEVLEFDSYADAQKWINENRSTYLRHNEYSSPDYTICAA